jgi:hypothetical protein
MSTRTIMVGLTLLLLTTLTASTIGITALAGVVPAAKPVILWSVGVLMLAILPAVTLKPVNLALLKLIGGAIPNNHQWQRIQPLLASVDATTSARTRPILVTRHDGMFSDIGFHAITVPYAALAHLSTDELRALLVQRARRQENLLSPMLGLCLWASLPLVLGFALAYVAYQVARIVGKVLNGVADGMKPKSELGAATGLLLYVGGFFAFIAALFIGAVILFQGLIASVVIIVGAWAFRRADLHTTADVAYPGWGAALRSALTKLDYARPRATGMWKVLAVRASLDAHLRQIAVT